MSHDPEKSRFHRLIALCNRAVDLYQADEDRRVLSDPSRHYLRALVRVFYILERHQPASLRDESEVAIGETLSQLETHYSAMTSGMERSKALDLAAVLTAERKKRKGGNSEGELDQGDD